MKLELWPFEVLLLERKIRLLFKIPSDNWVKCHSSQWHKKRVTTILRKALSQDGRHYMTCRIHLVILSY